MNALIELQNALDWPLNSYPYSSWYEPRLDALIRRLAEQLPGHLIEDVVELISIVREEHEPF